MTTHKQEYKEQIGAIQLTLIPSDKYKSNKIVFKFRAPLDRKTTTKRALIATLMETNTKKYPTQTAFRKELASLYGASFYASVDKKGNEHVITAILDMVDGQFVPNGDTLLEKAFTLIQEIIFNPNVIDGSFHEATVAREKENLVQRLESVYDDKIRYANKRLTEIMFANENYKYGAAGVLEDIPNITGTDLYDYYQQFLAEDTVDLFICGDVKKEDVIPLLKKLPFADRKYRELDVIAPIHPKEVHTVKENQPINQGKLVLGYRTNILFGEDAYVPLQLANGLLGGFANSKIFINVREKASLAYYASSRIDSFHGFMLISAGIDEKNYEQALTIIKEQVASMQTGDFTEEELAQTKAMLSNQLLEANDQAQGLIELAYNNTLKKANLDLSNWLKRISEVTKEEVVTAAKSFELDTIYFLSKGADSNE
ncbi:EF-P 5-aminopentanol modification-associated protein YfmF [Paenilisteria rocourtiae]|uniref:Putative Zn-dependent peptidase n=1 Tax=Listeria rocourtiae TaxID=647910 RepID=A0A4R6ZPJ1_9LIST|nr:pitrilysin family protein [Listeria rocourtiae]MBC1603754.1 insulinase family protein [Listeria rocourtiae]TDR54114.1 putative Zn-dependent peptidase [Listeria rocourtiae]